MMNKNFKFLNTYSDSEIQIYSRCIYDSRMSKIALNNYGVCNYCEQYEQMKEKYPTGDKGMEVLEKRFNKLKKMVSANVMML